jgi:glucose/arabinose dehydrogenase
MLPTIRNQTLLLATMTLLGSAGCAKDNPSSKPDAPAPAPAAPGSLAPERPRLPNMEIVRPGEKVTLAPPYATRSANNGPRVAPPPEGALPKVPKGYAVSVWTKDVKNPRHMTLAPNGDVFVAESNQDRVKIFRDTDHDGKPDQTFIFAEDLHQPFGLAFYKGSLFVGDTDAVVRFDYKDGQTQASSGPEKITDLTPGGYNQHWTRNVIADAKRSKLYVSVGSGTNVDVEQPPRASILEMNPDGSGRHEYAGGLRNPVGLAINPTTGRLWTAVNERDGLGDDLPPDYATEVKPGGFYGWPYAYIGPNEDPRRKGERPDLVKRAIVPDVLLGPHTAALAIAFNPGTMLPGKGDAYVTLHGSWNRSARDGYKVMRIPFKNGRPSADPVDFLNGFILDDSHVWGRPVGLVFLKDGSLLVSEDGNDTIYRVTYPAGK